MKKKISILLICILIVGCGKKKTENVITQDNNKIEPVTNNVVESKKISKVILNKKNVKITINSIDYNSLGEISLNMLIENNSNEKIIVQHDNLSINGFMIDAFFSEEVNPGKKVNGSLLLVTDDLERANIKNIENIEFIINIINSDYETIFQEKNINIEINNQNHEQDYTNNGKIIYDKGGIKIKKIGSDEESSIGKSIIFYIENNTKQDITIQSENTLVNGEQINPSFLVSIVSGKKIYGKMIFPYENLNEKNITKIKTIELDFLVLEKNTYSRIFETEKLKFEF